MNIKYNKIKRSPSVLADSICVFKAQDKTQTAEKKQQQMLLLLAAAAAAIVAAAAAAAAANSHQILGGNKQAPT